MRTFTWLALAGGVGLFTVSGCGDESSPAEEESQDADAAVRDADVIRDDVGDTPDAQGTANDASIDGGASDAAIADASDGSLDAGPDGGSPDASADGGNSDASADGGNLDAGTDSGAGALAPNSYKLTPGATFTITNAECNWQPSISGFLVRALTSGTERLGILFDGITPSASEYAVAAYADLYAANECGVTVYSGGALRDSTGGGTVTHRVVSGTHQFIVADVPIANGATVNGFIVCDTFVSN